MIICFEISKWNIQYLPLRMLWRVPKPQKTHCELLPAVSEGFNSWDDGYAASHKVSILQQSCAYRPAERPAIISWQVQCSSLGMDMPHQSELLDCQLLFLQPVTWAACLLRELVKVWGGDLWALTQILAPSIQTTWGIQDEVRMSPICLLIRVLIRWDIFVSSGSHVTRLAADRDHRRSVFIQATQPSIFIRCVTKKRLPSNWDSVHWGEGTPWHSSEKPLCPLFMQLLTI